MKIHRYRPNYFSGFEKESAEISSMDEFLQVPWVEQWMEDKGFVKFIYDKYHPMQDFIFVIINNKGKEEKWGVAYTYDVDSGVLDKLIEDG